MSTYTKESFIGLERRVWTTLTKGDSETDAQLLADDFLGVYPSGFAVKADHVGQMEAGPTIARYKLFDARMQILSDEVVLLSYRAQFTRNAPGAAPESMYVTSIWRLFDGAWKNVFSQDTPASS